MSPLQINVILKLTYFWDIELCSSVKVDLNILIALVMEAVNTSETSV
jgi:hypothetical protein